MTVVTSVTGMMASWCLAAVSAAMVKLLWIMLMEIDCYAALDMHWHASNKLGQRQSWQPTTHLTAA